MSGACCVPGPADLPSPGTGPAPGSTPAPTARRAPAARGLVAVPGGTARLGDHHGDGYAGDGEQPVHTVTLTPYRLGATSVTNQAFAAFVRDTGYRTTAEREGSSAVFHLDFAGRRADVVGSSPQAPWWLSVAGAYWRQPEGPGSDVERRQNHPVVHVSHDDALAYTAWAGCRLPTEAEWELAARGGLDGARYPWGDEVRPRGRWQCNIFQGDFPARNDVEDGWASTAPVKTFAPNGYGLHQMVGNVWEWCADWFSAAAYLADRAQDPTGPQEGITRVMRGGSFLCHDSYCNRYRVAARSSAPPDSSSSNLGFRCAADA